MRQPPARGRTTSTLLLTLLLTSLAASSSSKKRQVRGVKATLEAGWEMVKNLDRRKWTPT